ncbi:IPT/TIG domain-containing protein [Pedobacter deserti]|uniref:IPT/TIG domain-containing protein n=1 Tax=Pedobacter deserti TaxID=2817382 RepID=UPI00210BFA7D|nr:IPT/TIG domain-containing protein [Pedobacter sp. SYSU D00382]
MKTHLHHYLLVFVSLLVFFSCKKDEDGLEPVVETVLIEAESSTTLVFSGNLISTKNTGVQDLGFIYSHDAKPDEKNGVKISLGSKVKSGAFNTTVKNLRLNEDFGYPRTVYGMAYVKHKKGTTFGNVLKLTMPMPAISRISPAAAKSGDVVKISGKFNHPQLAEVRVLFEDNSAKVISATDTEISVEVPSGLKTIHGMQAKVTVLIGDIPAIKYLTILANILDYSPKEGPMGSILTITGENMLNSYRQETDINQFTILFGNRQPYFLVGNTMRIQVPSGISGKVPLSVSYHGQTINLPEFTVYAPKIKEMTSEPVFPGSRLKVDIENYELLNGPAEDAPKVRLGDGAYIPINYHGRNNYFFPVPGNIKPGTYDLTLKLGSLELHGSSRITVKPFFVTGFSPASGGPGTVINIEGTFEKDRFYLVNFGEIKDGAVAQSATHLQIAVPYSTFVGKVKLSVNIQENLFTAPGEFEITRRQ